MYLVLNRCGKVVARFRTLVLAQGAVDGDDDFEIVFCGGEA